MKRFIVKNAIIVFVLLTSAMSFAQGDFGDPTDPNPTDAPIGDYIWVLGLFGLAYVFFKMKNRIQANSN